ncbi:MAG: hypothetical protein E5Y10_04355 [Mesorhizobium sp.]|nr:MAG: hypothetical protein E5Y19_21170 [Mesorhizobium sp.]TIN42879.1 MAG: hypothetical protein E5Y13_03645 [Mesorhizobium sp.]TJU87965.1 MAG: hypothetical protein E5Y15_05585 [Mesorhizobium sp.]TJU91818.1 MAG: hypothetical protein E5Y10_04355 [Mesorhizobium sp.]
MFGFPQALCAVPQKLALLRRRTFRDAGGTAPPSALPGISPLGGRSAVVPAFANFQHRSRSAAPKLPISPLVGEMPSFGREGRTEGGAKDRQPSWFRVRRRAGRRFHR